jgi:hypothetical protein
MSQEKLSLASVILQLNENRRKKAYMRYEKELEENKKNQVIPEVDNVVLCSGYDDSHYVNMAIIDCEKGNYKILKYDDRIKSIFPRITHSARELDMFIRHKNSNNSTVYFSKGYIYYALNYSIYEEKYKLQRDLAEMPAHISEYIIPCGKKSLTISQNKEGIITVREGMFVSSDICMVYHDEDDINDKKEYPQYFKLSPIPDLQYNKFCERQYLPYESIHILSSSCSSSSSSSSSCSSSYDDDCDNGYDDGYDDKYYDDCDDGYYHQ